MLRFGFALALAATTMTTAHAFAHGSTPAAPTTAPAATPVDFVLESTAGDKRALSAYRGQVVVLFYEDRHHTEVNDKLKAALGRLNESLPASERFVLVGVANLKGLDFFPAAGFARTAVRNAAAKAKVEILLDWDGTVIQRLGVRDDDANVAVVDRRGFLRHRAHGVLGEDGQRSLVAAIAAAR